MRMTAILRALAPVLLCAAAGAQTSAIDELLAKAAKWEYDQNREPLRAVADAVQKAQGSPAATRDIETRFIGFLKSDATPGSKDFICRQLSLMGSEASVPVLAGMLGQASTAEMARFALERIPGASVDRALREGLSNSAGAARIGIIGALGKRRDAAAVVLLRPLASGADEPAAVASLNALSDIADPGAVQALVEALGKASGAARLRAAEACLRAADNLTARGNKAAALPVYQKLYGESEPAIVRAGALQGLIATQAQPGPVLTTALRGEDLRLQAMAIAALSRGEGVKQLMAELPKLSEAGRVRVLGVLSENRRPGVLPAFTASLKDSSKPVRLAAIEGLGVVGDASAVPALTDLAASGSDDAERAAARSAIARIPGKDVDAKLAEGLAGGDPKTRLETIRAVGARGASSATPMLLKLARDPDDEVRRESLRALRTTASTSDVAGLVALVTNPLRAGDRAEAVRSLGSLVRRSEAGRVQDVVTAYSGAADVEARAALIQVLGQSGDASALPLLRAALKDETPEIKRGAILALSDWPDATPLPELFEAGRGAASPSHQVLALRGAIKLIGLPVPARSAAQSVKLLGDAMALAKGVEEKRAVLALLPKYPIPAALELATAALNDKDVSTEAKAAVARLERTVKR